MARKANNPQNLKPFKKGQSGNPAGRPKKLPDLDILLAEVLGEEKNNVTAMEGILLVLRKKALSGDIRACEVLMERSYGKVKNLTDLSLNIEHLSDKELDLIINRLLNAKQ